MLNLIMNNLKRISFLCFLLAIMLSISLANNKSTVIVSKTSEKLIVLTIDPIIHQNYGAAYPVTYIFDNKSGIDELSVAKKYSQKSNWEKLSYNVSSKSYNGIETVRIDTNTKKIYLSVSFSSQSDSIVIRFQNKSGEIIELEYEGISKYYDNRQAVVTASADDWHMWFNDAFNQTVNKFRKYNLYITCGAVTEKNIFNGEILNDIQNQLNKGFLELAAHSRNHLHTEYADIEYEVTGNRNDILANFQLPENYRNGKKQYVYVWIGPYGDYTENTDVVVRKNNFLLPRLYKPGETDVALWNSEKQIFNPQGMTVEIGRPEWGGGESNLDTLNSIFNKVLNKNGVYHIMCHPQELVKDWDKMPYLEEHLSFISNRKNVWYVSLGHLYLYQLIYQTSIKY